MLEYFGTEFESTDCDSTDWYSVMDRNRNKKISHAVGIVHAEILHPTNYIL